MNTIKLAVIASAIIATVSVSIATAHQEYIGSMIIHHPWARASATSLAKTGAVYLKLENSGPSEITLTGASTDVAKKAELHTHIMSDNGVMKMRPVEGGIPIAGKETVELKPGGLHIMLMGLPAPLFEGELFDITLTFSDGSTGTVPVEVMGVAAGASVGHDMSDESDNHEN